MSSYENCKTCKTIKLLSEKYSQKVILKIGVFGHYDIYIKSIDGTEIKINDIINFFINKNNDKLEILKEEYIKAMEDIKEYVIDQIGEIKENE